MSRNPHVVGAQKHLHDAKKNELEATGEEVNVRCDAQKVTRNIML